MRREHDRTVRAAGAADAESTDATPLDGELIESDLSDLDIVDAEVVNGDVADGAAGASQPAAAAPSPAPVTLTAEDLGIDVPQDEDEARQVLLTEIVLSRQAAGEYLDQLQRVAADYENFRRRSDRDRSEIASRTTQQLVNELLPALDAFDAALAYESSTAAEEKILAGMRSTYNQLMETLKRHDLGVIDAVDAAFDPAVHEAVSGGGDGDLVVTEVLRTGYTIGGRVVRPALVMVGVRDGAPGDEG